MLVIGLILALAPAAVLLVLIYKQDVVEKESWGMIGKVFAFGVVSVIPTLIFEILIDNGLLLIFSDTSLIYVFISNFIGVALVEEGFKCLAIYFGAWKSREFNYTFDGIVYGAAAALGFAAIENVEYVLLGDDMFGIAFSRALLSVPGHMADGIFMGYFIGLAKYAKYTGNAGKVPMYIVFALGAPIIEHCIYDFTLSLGDGVLVDIFFFPYVIVVYAIAIFLVIKSRGKRDKMIPIPGQPAGRAARAAQPVAYQPAAGVTVGTPRFCGHCGNPVVPGNNFCTKCGSKIS